VADQKIALITGGNRGLGRATALSLAAAGVDIILTYRSGRAEADTVAASVSELGRDAVALGQAALGRVGEPGDIGGAIAALLSEGNHWMTAQRLEVSGGTLL
jgi:NAD(P)-dependent dehydrogenase (short-subunit alcohol dehydrogenase family)